MKIAIHSTLLILAILQAAVSQSISIRRRAKDNTVAVGWSWRRFSIEAIVTLLVLEAGWQITAAIPSV